MATTKRIIAEGTVEWVKIFPDHFDDNMQYHENTKGQYNMVFYPDNLEKFIADGYPEQKGAFKTIKEGNPQYGSGKFVKLKRPVYNPNLPNEEGGKGVYMSAPVVLNRTEDPAGSEEWSYSEDGPIGNGSRVKVQVSVYYGDRATIDTLDKVAVVELETYEAGDTF